MIAAFFDFDGTLYTGHAWRDLMGHHRAARRHRRWVAAYFLRNMAPLPLYRAGLISQDRFILAWAETMGWMVRGWTLEEGQALFERLTEERVMPNLRADVLETLRHHQAQGHMVALVSGNFTPWLEVIAGRLGVAHAIGTILEVRDGCYTGRTVPPVCQGDGKPLRVAAYLAERDLDIDWPASHAYADRIQDLDLLELAGHPVAVYPEERLLVEAHARDWPVIAEEGA